MWVRESVLMEMCLLLGPQEGRLALQPWKSAELTYLGEVGFIGDSLDAKRGGGQQECKVVDGLVPKRTRAA